MIAEPAIAPGITRYRDRHVGEDVYVVAAGGSLNYLDRRFFEGKTVVAVNEIASRWGRPSPDEPIVGEPLRPTYGVCKEESTILEVQDIGYPLIASLHENGHTGNPARTPEDYRPNVSLFPHGQNHAWEWDAYQHWPADPDSLVVSMSTITSAIHFAAYLGARFIFVAGHDCGVVGDMDYVRGYTAPTGEWKLPWLQAIERQTIALKRELLRRYPGLLGIYGLSPFVTPNLEGVPYRGANRINDW